MDHLLPVAACALVGVAACAGANDELFPRVPDVTPPTFAGVRQVTADTAYSLRLRWDAAVDDLSRDYQLEYRAYVAEVPGAQDFTRPRSRIVGTTGGLVGGLAPNRRYFIVVHAFDRAGNGETNTVEQTVVTPADPGRMRSYIAEVYPLLRRSCIEVGCHNPPEPQQGMDFSMAETAYGALFERRSNEHPELARVAPRDSGQSYMVRKLTGFISPRTDGSVMPPPPFLRLSEAELALIREWIDQGALDN